MEGWAEEDTRRKLLRNLSALRSVVDRQLALVDSEAVGTEEVGLAIEAGLGTEAGLAIAAVAFGEEEEAVGMVEAEVEGTATVVGTEVEGVGSGIRVTGCRLTVLPPGREAVVSAEVVATEVEEEVGVGTTIARQGTRIMSPCRREEVGIGTATVGVEVEVGMEAEGRSGRMKVGEGVGMMIVGLGDDTDCAVFCCDVDMVRLPLSVY